MSGFFVHILAATAGLSAIIAASATAFDIVKYVGAVYLVYLGIRTLRSKSSSFKIKEHMPRLSYSKIFWQGVITNVLNPKVALFFLAFLPQFIDINAGHMQGRVLFLGIWFDMGGTLVNVLVAVLFGRIGQWLGRNPRWLRWQEKITGMVLIALGIKVALTSKK